jgi:hypothetical protein
MNDESGVDENESFDDQDVAQKSDGKNLEKIDDDDGDDDNRLGRRNFCRYIIVLRYLVVTALVSIHRVQMESEHVLDTVCRVGLFGCGFFARRTYNIEGFDIPHLPKDTVGNLWYVILRHGATRLLPSTHFFSCHRHWSTTKRCSNGDINQPNDATPSATTPSDINDGDIDNDTGLKIQSGYPQKDTERQPLSLFLVDITLNNIKRTNEQTKNRCGRRQTKHHQ